MVFALGSQGRCQVGGWRARLVPTLHPHRSIRQPSDAGDIAPSLKGTITGGSVVGSGQVVAAKLEEIVGLAVAGEEPLGVPCRLEPLHLPFSSSRWLVRDLGPVR